LVSIIKENLTPAMRQWRRFKEQHPDKIILFRMGDFYEIFGEDALTVAPVLEIVLTTRDRDTKDPLPMCGVPHHALEIYLQKLLKATFKAVIVDQVEDPKKAKGIVKREITRILTPGTLLEDNLVEKEERILIASIYENKDECSISYADLSKGEIKVATGKRDEIFELLHSLSPKEVVVKEGISFENSPFFVTPLNSSFFDLRKCVEKISSYYNLPFSLPGIAPQESARISLGALIHYLEEQKSPPLDFPKIETLNGRVLIDESTRKNLELIFNLEDNTRDGTLLKTLDCCLTPMGKRLLNEAIVAPYSDKSEIEKIQEEVKEYLSNTSLLKNFRKSISNFPDWARINARFGANIATPRDAYALKEVLFKVKESLKYALQYENKPKARAMMIPSFDELASFLESAIVDNPPNSTKEGGIFKKNFNEKLDELRDLSQNAHLAIIKLEAKERERSGISSLKIKYNKVFGYFIEITKANLDKVPEDYERKQTLVNAERFVTKEIRELETKILSAKEQSVELEESFWADLCERVKSNLKDLRDGANLFAELDLYSSYAFLIYERGYVLPKISDDLTLKIEEGRHPVLERDEKHKPFVPNSTFLDGDKRQLAIITGPNMGGKSTYLRQVGLITIMAHLGMGIPAKSGEIGVVDRIFCRIGASDNLRRGLSTFMVEMSESSAILRNSTRKSLVLLDEIGRGTSTFDGLAIAWAIAEALSKEKGIGARTFFATHYHELTELSRTLEGVFNLTMGVREHNGKVYFLRTVEEGSLDKSYGIHVAQLAGIPENVVNRAREVLYNLEKTRKEGALKKGGALQPTLFEETEKDEEIVEKIKDLDLKNLTPIDALLFLDKIKKEID
jgi:DNA mismatch repair protein MutS